MFLRSGFVSAIVGVAALFVAEASHAATPTLMWQDVRRVAVQCLVQPTTVANAALARSMCARTRAIAARGASMPVTTVAIGDPAVLAAGTVTLLVHALVQAGAQANVRAGRLLAFSIRPFRVSADQNAVLFGAAPRAVVLPASGGPGPALDVALAASLSETLPWQQRSQGARPIAGRR